MELVLDPAAEAEMRRAAFFYEDCRTWIYVAAVMHLKRKPDYWLNRVTDT